MNGFWLWWCTIWGALGLLIVAALVLFLLVCVAVSLWQEFIGAIAMAQYRIELRERAKKEPAP